MSAALEARGLMKSFGGLTATNNVSLSLPQGARHALIGPNGAGKTTLINLLTGHLQPNGGQVLLAGREVTALPPHARVAQGLARTFQINQLYAEFTPRETLILAAAQRQGLAGRWWRPIGAHAALQADAETILAELGLADLADRRVGSLAYGKQRLLEIAVALAARPTVLLLDEPAAGVAEADRQQILACIDRLPPSVSLLLIDHDMDLVFRFARTISVLVNGAVLVEGAAATIARDPRVRQVYLGEAGHG